MSDNPRVVRQSKVRGFFLPPIGVTVCGVPSGEAIGMLDVSTVCLENGHLEDPLRICEPEHGYETAVFMDGCSLFTLFTAHYDNRRQAIAGHRSVVRKIIAGKTPARYYIRSLLWL